MEHGPSPLLHGFDGNLVLRASKADSGARQRLRSYCLPRFIGELSPAINMRLSAFNDRLVELLKP